MPLISVIMPVYNDAAYVGDAINSILQQTITDFEFIIINDGSTDGSLQKITSFTDERIRLVTNAQNLGVAASLNKGLAVATGEWIARMDGDDISHPRRFEEQLAFLRKHPNVGLLGTNYYNVTKKKIIVNPPLLHNEIALTLLFTTPFAHSAVMYKRSIQQQHQLLYSTAYPYNEDHHYWMQWIKVTQCANLNSLLFTRRITPDAVLANHYSRANTARMVLGMQQAAWLSESIGLPAAHPEYLYLPPGRQKKLAFKALIQFNRETQFVSHHFLNGLLLTYWFNDLKPVLHTASPKQLLQYFSFPGLKNAAFWMTAVRGFYYYLFNKQG